MWIKPFDEVPAKPVENPEVQGVTMRVLVGPEQSAPTFTMRHFTVAPGGHTPRHTHPYEHEIFFLSGEGEVFYEGSTVAVRGGTVAYVAPNADHQIRAVGAAPLTFLCLVPKGI
jgi:quercetin dioxygenase-like cupin family protein